MYLQPLLLLSLSTILIVTKSTINKNNNESCLEDSALDAVTNDNLVNVNIPIIIQVSSYDNPVNLIDSNSDDLYATCDSNYYAISCSVRYHEKTEYPVSWGAWPSLDGQSCICHKSATINDKNDENSIENTECFANCALKSIVRDHSIESKNTLKGGTALCPIGSKLTGCGFKEEIRSFQYWRDVYPKIIRNNVQNNIYNSENINNMNDNEVNNNNNNNHQEGCFCYSNYGAMCYAICASNVINHSFEKTVDQPYGKSKCSKKYSNNDNSDESDSYVLGCGIKSNMKQAVKYPASGFWKEDMNGKNGNENRNESVCAAYDQFGVISHAICGKFDY